MAECKNDVWGQLNALVKQRTFLTAEFTWA